MKSPLVSQLASEKHAAEANTCRRPPWDSLT